MHSVLFIFQSAVGSHLWCLTCCSHCDCWIVDSVCLFYVCTVVGRT